MSKNDFYAINAYEKETIILFNNAEQTASVYTHDSRLMRKLEEALEKYPDQCQKTDESGESVTVEIPKKWINIMLPREYSEEGRKEMEERMARMRAKRWKLKRKMR